MPIRRGTALAFTLLLVAGLPLEGRADPAADRARAHNQSAKRLFSVGLFEQAADEYTRAYQAKPLPLFLFNLAQCHKRLAGRPHLEKAIFYFKSYIANEPGTPMREEIEKESGRLERKLRAMPSSAPVVGGTDTPRRGAPVYKRWWFWTLIGAAVVGAAVGTGVALRPEAMEPIKGSLTTWDLR